MTCPGRSHTARSRRPPTAPRPATDESPGALAGHCQQSRVPGVHDAAPSHCTRLPGHAGPVGPDRDPGRGPLWRGCHCPSRRHRFTAFRSIPSSWAIAFTLSPRANRASTSCTVSSRNIGSSLLCGSKPTGLRRVSVISLLLGCEGGGNFR